MSKKIIIILAVLIIIVGGGSFYGGMKFGQNQKPAFANGQGRGFADLSPADRQARAEQFGGQAGAGAGRGMGGFTSGELLTKDTNSFTIKLPSGGSKMIIFATSTSVLKSSPGALSDLQVGDTLMISGQANPDGSITAGSIQVRPK